MVRPACALWGCTSRRELITANEANLATARDNLRHASLSTTSIYLHTVEEKRARIVGGSSPDGHAKSGISPSGGRVLGCVGKKIRFGLTSPIWNLIDNKGWTNLVAEVLKSQHNQVRSIVRSAATCARKSCGVMP